MAFSSIQGSKFIDNWHHRPEQILSVGDLVLVATRASTLYVFDRDQHCIVRRFDVSPVSSLLGKHLLNAVERVYVGFCV